MSEHTQVAVDAITILDRFRKSPKLYTGTDDPASIAILIIGMMMGLEACGYGWIMPRNDPIEEALMEERGWTTDGNHIDQMKAKGMSNLEITNEMIEISIMSIRRRMGI